MQKRAFFLKLSAATLLMGGLIGFLSWQKNSSASTVHAESKGAPRGGAPSAHSPFALLPSGAWLVADFSTTWIEKRPFAGDPEPCHSVPIPPRGQLALYAPPPGDELPLLLLALPEVTEQFLSCAEQKILQSGGEPVEQNPQFRTLKNPAGTFLLFAERGLLYSSHPDLLTAALKKLSPGGAENAHSAPYRSLAELPELPLRAQLELPAGWLESLSSDAERSPLRALRSALLTIESQGSAHATIHCTPELCSELREFFERVSRDLLAELPPTHRALLSDALRVHSPAGEPTIFLELSSAGVQMVKQGLDNWIFAPHP